MGFLVAPNQEWLLALYGVNLLVIQNIDLVFGFYRGSCCVIVRIISLNLWKDYW